MADKPVQCFVGSRSSWENLKLIPKDKRPRLNALTEANRGVIMNELDDALPRPWQDKTWNMIWRRWLAYESLCNQG